MNKIKSISLILLSFFLVKTLPANAATASLLAVSIDGIVYQVDTKTGALTAISGEQVHDYNLGGIARSNKFLYYIAAPEGSNENAIYTYNIKSKTLSHVDLDKSEGDDDIRVMFLKGNKLYAIFYNGNAGTAGLYKINPSSGATTLVLDLSDLNVEPIGGAFTKANDSYYTIVKPEIDSTRRQLLKFRASAKTPVLTEILAKDSTSVRCDRLKYINKSQNFICLASPETTKVDVCKLSEKGLAICKGTLSNIERVAGGHSMLSPDSSKLYAFVYEIGDPDSQRLIQFTAKGGIKSKVTIGGIITGAQFDTDGIGQQAK